MCQSVVLQQTQACACAHLSACMSGWPGAHRTAPGSLWSVQSNRTCKLRGSRTTCLETTTIQGMSLKEFNKTEQLNASLSMFGFERTEGLAAEAMFSPWNIIQVEAGRQAG